MRSYNGPDRIKRNLLLLYILEGFGENNGLLENLEK